MHRMTTTALVLLCLGCGPRPEVRSAAEAQDEAEPPRTEPAPAPESTPKTDLKASIEWAVEMLEQKKHAELLEGIMHPDDKAKAISEKGSLEALAREFGSGNKPRALLEMLRVIMDREPVMNEEGTEAIFDLTDMEEALEDVIVFELVDGRWCIRN